MPAVDLSELPTPQIIEELNFESILAEVKENIITAFPLIQQDAVRSAMALESEPLTIIAQTFAFRELLLRQRVNEGAAACMLSHSTGSDLDNLAANMNTTRLIIIPATDTTDAVMESDTALRLRAQSAFDGLSVAGPTGAYEYLPAVPATGADARASSPAPAEVVVAVLSTEGDGTATEELLTTVRNALNAEDVRPVGDRLTVQSAEIIRYQIDARLYFYPGPESEPILNAARRNLKAWLAEQGKIGRDVALSAIMAALHVQGVQRVELTSPAQNIVINNTQAAYCTSFSISTGGTDE
ncbi:baseplate assembly protein [Escherichia coli]|uniref:baseplate assembly protein n=1 Tax=Escherichia coli TaxID=562 RepID=UPI001BD49ACC|nr:baseplate J/gp47 family protein [Escherichia coli]QVT90239.1 baseplate J/gp47 family protein [Escherichia coli]